MKQLASRTAVSLAAAAMLMTTASPAMARHWHHRNRGVDAGDVIAGVLIIGGIAAVASAATRNNRDRDRARYPSRYPDYRGDYRYPNRDYRGDYRNRDYRGDDYRYGDRDDRDGYQGAGMIDGAVETCVREVERGNREVDTVDAANREGDGWRIEGQMQGGGLFACNIGSDMRVRNATVDGRAVY